MPQFIYSFTYRRACGLLPYLDNYKIQFSSVQSSHSVVSDYLRPHELQHVRPPCPSPTARVYPNPCPLSRGCHSTISSFVVPFSSCPQSLPASESLPMSLLFTWGGQSTGVSALASFLPKNTQGWSPLERTGWISLQSKGLSWILLIHKINRIMPQSRTCMNFETIMLNDISQT